MATGIDFGSDHLRLCRVNWKGGRPRVSGLVNQPMNVEAGSKAYWAMAQRVLEQVQEYGQIKDPILGVTGRDLNLTYQRLGKLPLSTLRKMVRFELEGVEGGDNILAGGSVFDAGHEYTFVIGKVMRTALDERAGLIQRVGGQLKDITPSCYALYNAYLMSNPPEGESVLLLDIGREYTEVVLVEEGHMAYARSVTGGGNVFIQAIQNLKECGEAEAESFMKSHASLRPKSTEAEEIYPQLRSAAGQLAKTVQSALSFAKLQLKITPKFDRLLLSGGGASIDGLTDFFGGTFKCDGDFLDPFAGSDLSKLSPEAKALAAQTPNRFAVSFGLAVGGANPSKTIHLSLVPESARKTSKFSGRTVASVGGGILLGLGLLLGFAAGSQASSGQAAAVDEMQVTKSEIDGQLKQFANYSKVQRGMDARLDQLRDLVEGGYGTYDILARLRSVLPRDMWVTTIEFGQEKKKEQRWGEDDEVRRPNQLVISGEANQATVADPGSVLNRLAREIEDPVRGISAKVQLFDGEKPGLIKYQLTVTFP